MTEKINKGGISVDTEHIFPIIKKWLYSEKDIFLREIISNASDAITKLKRLESLGLREMTDEKYLITVKLDTDEGTLTVSDNGIGMSAEELEKYRDEKFSAVPGDIAEEMVDNWQKYLKIAGWVLGGIILFALIIFGIKAFVSYNDVR